MGNDKRLDALIAELERMVETANEEIASAKNAAALTELSWLEKINQQRGRIMERESMLSDTGQAGHNAPQSQNNGGSSDFRKEFDEALTDTLRKSG